MPALTFILPHWLYWSGLVLFPFAAMYLVRRQRRAPPHPGPHRFVAYLLWLCAGFLGMHRFYLKSLAGFVFIPFFLGILYCNDHIRDERENVSRTRAQLEQAAPALERLQKRIEAGSRGAVTELEDAKRDLTQAREQFDAAEAELGFWRNAARILASLLALMLLVDAAWIPRLVRRRRAIEDTAAARVPQPPVAPPVPEVGTGEDPTLGMRMPRGLGWIDTMNGWIGEYVAYWGVIAVFVYYYEVVARYVFNSPTNWVHESMFLMFGMQYMLCGAYGYRDDSHVRVDVFYARLSPRGRAFCDVLTSVFFFVFTVTMFVTGWRFAMDSIGFDEHSFTEWGIQYWPVKLAIPIGAALIVLQGIVRLVRDVMLLLAPDEAAVLAPRTEA